MRQLPLGIPKPSENGSEKTCSQVTLIPETVKSIESEHAEPHFLPQAVIPGTGGLAFATVRWIGHAMSSSLPFLNTH